MAIALVVFCYLLKKKTTAKLL